MDLNYSTEELAFRDEVRAWLGANLPGDLRQKMESYAELSKNDPNACAAHRSFTPSSVERARSAAGKRAMRAPGPLQRDVGQRSVTTQ